MSISPTSNTWAGRLDQLYEFEREPVSSDQLKDGRYFAACFAGEHIAATEFVIGAMFAKHGVGARDLLLGLAVGNLLAVLSWVLICAPVAVQVRLTLYWYLRRIAGPRLAVLYNIVAGVLFCILAGAMIAVSSSAVLLGVNEAAHVLGSGIHIKHPELHDVLPNSIGWVMVVLVVGMVVVGLAIMGFKKLSQFAAVCAPWMFTLFISGALVTLPRLGSVQSLGELWTIADTRIWNGIAAPGQEKLGFWHIAFFAWFCNLAVHIGLSDMALFRYARRWTYGFYSAFGMFLGHYLSWICAGVMGATVTGLNPGQMSVMAAGVVGPLAVVLAGWTTANPTLYRAGLALQIATPNWPRWKVTLAAGMITTFLACFPVFFVRLLDFVAIFGLTLMPIGAIVIAEHWLLPRLGMRRYWTTEQNRLLNPAALLTWLFILAITFPFEQFTAGAIRSPMAMLNIHLYYRWLPGWIIAVILYCVLAALMGARRIVGQEDCDGLVNAKPTLDTPQQPVITNTPTTMSSRLPASLATWFTGAIAIASLLICVVMAARVFIGGGSNPELLEANIENYKRGLLVCTVIYFVAAVYWQIQRERTHRRWDKPRSETGIH